MLTFHYSGFDGKPIGIPRKNDADNEVIELPGKGSDWDPNMHDLIIGIRFSLDDISHLFDLDKGLANLDSSIGVAIVIASKESNTRTVHPSPISLTQSSRTESFVFSINLPRGVYRGSFSIRCILYLKERSLSPQIPYFTNNEGFVFGSLFESKVYIDDRSPEFPTVVVRRSPSDPLWRLETSWKDPRSDSFLETVHITINSAYPGFKEVWGTNSKERAKQSLKVEIYSSAIAQVILRLRSDGEIWSDMVNGNIDGISDGSVCDYILYILERKLEDPLMDPTDIAYNLRRLLGGV